MGVDKLDFQLNIQEIDNLAIVIIFLFSSHNFYLFSCFASFIETHAATLQN